MARTPRVLVVLALLGGCGHADDLVITAPEGPAPARVERPAALRRHVRARARDARRPRERASFLMPSGMPAAQRVHPEWAELVDASRTRDDLAGRFKAHGERLLLLHDGRLLVVALAPTLRIVADEPLGADHGASLLVHGDQVVVVLPGPIDPTRPGRTELRRFTIAGDGRLTRGRSIHLRGAHASFSTVERIVDGKLVIHRQSSLARPPKIWRGGRWQPLVRTADLQRPVVPASSVHVLLRCDLGPRPDCRAAGVIAPWTSYLQADADALVFWAGAHVWRMPFDGAPATVVRAVGRPLDLLAWRLDRGDLDAVVATAEGHALLQISAATLRAGLTTVTAARPIAPPTRDEFAARFIGAHLLYTDTPDWACDGATTLRVRTLADDTETTLDVPHCVGRIEPTTATAALAIEAPHATPNAPVKLTAIDLRTTPILGDTRTYTGVHADVVRAAGPYPLGGPRRGLSPDSTSPLPIVTQDGPHLHAAGDLPGHGDLDHAFTYAGRIYTVRDRTLTEYEVTATPPTERRRLALDPDRRQARPRYKP